MGLAKRAWGARPAAEMCVDGGGGDGDRNLWLLVAPVDGGGSLARATVSKLPTWAGGVVTHALNICFMCHDLL